jgi:hypothetical protein
MPQRKFANPKGLIDYAEQNALVYVWEFVKRQRPLSPQPVWALLFSKAILQAELAEFAANTETMAVNRERFRAKRAAKQGPTRGGE